MAGIGFELRRLLARDSYAGLVGAYGYAGLVSSGPWVLAIGGVLAIAAVARGASSPEQLNQFQVAVTWLMASSLLFTGPLQFVFGRYVADRIYEERREEVLPNLLGALAVTTLCAGSLAAVVVFLAIPAPFASRVLMLASFVALCNSWVLVVLLAGAKAHRTVVGLYLAAWLTSLALAWALRARGLEGLLAGFAAGQAAAAFSMTGVAMHAFPGERQVRFDFLRPGATKPYLAATGGAFYAGIWADKLVFWLWPATSAPVLGPMRSSIFYDLPLFLAYLTTIPAMAVLFLRLEAGFADRCQGFFLSVQEGASLKRLEALRDEMAGTLRRDFLDIALVQALAFTAVLVYGPALLRLVGASPHYLQLLWIGAAGVSLQVPFLAALNVLFYLDERKDALLLALLFAAVNLALSALSVWLGPDWYGTGFAAAALVGCAGALPVVWRRLGRLERDTFMRQPLWPRENQGRSPFRLPRLHDAHRVVEVGGMSSPPSEPAGDEGGGTP